MGDVIAAVLILLGCALALVAAIGLQRFDDVFARMHAATKPATLGVALVLVGTAVRLATLGDAAKLALVLALQFTTAPTAAHMVARAAYRSGNELSPHTVVDELGSGRAEEE